MFDFLHNALVYVSCLLFMSCEVETKPVADTPLRSFETSFESISDFEDFYLVSPGEYDSSHEKTSDVVYDGEFSHKAWILKARADHNDGYRYLPHRAYPTIQFQKTADGLMRSPVLVSLWVYVDINLIDKPKGKIDDWLSLVTLTPDSSDDWSRTVLVNLTPDGYLKLVHVPWQGQQERIYQADTMNDPEGNLLFPQKEWVRLDIYLDLDKNDGYAKVWQNGNLLSQAKVLGGDGYLAQAHFGLYASAAVSAGTVYNDKLRIIEVLDEASALKLVGSSW